MQREKKGKYKLNKNLILNINIKHKQRGNYFLLPKTF